MDCQSEYFHCGDHLRTVLSNEIAEVFSAVASVSWAPEFRHADQLHQAAYNAAFADEFRSLGWSLQPHLRSSPRLIGDFQKGLVFGEIQFGNSSTLYRDYYKFQYGLANGLLSLAVLIVPVSAEKFFPTRGNSVTNMAEYGLAHRCLGILPINVPTLLIGLLPA